MKKIASKLMIGALTLAVFAPTAAFAATNTNVDETKVEQSSHQKYGYFSLEDRQSNQEELMKIINKYNPDLADDFQKLFDKVRSVKTDEAMKKLDETKKKLDEINEQVKNGTLTQEQANKKFEELGVVSTLAESALTQEQANEKRYVILSDSKIEKVELNEETKKELDKTKKKLDEIDAQVKNGTLTQEQAKEEMKKFGIKVAVCDGNENIMEQIKVAADKDDADTVNKLLHELLEKMQDKKQSIMAAE
ncbi:hypothetical protein [Brevibacillus halotolerans]|uniref:hypothetical protein n=1 Tax=Brevibacillus halotolerans TaxID=1507437 RepID=UPI0015EEC65D|nr:hypothetical protein [Brevibacillus halotolerans]MBA4535227.1 hypothetical protein [Brevibacillus halotolerans]